MAVPKVESEAIEEFEKRLEEHPDIERKGANNPYTAVNGNMFSAVNKDGQVGIRLSKEDHAAFIDQHDSEQFMSYGAKMNGYVVVPLKVVSDKKLFKKWFDKSFEFASSLKPKPTKKKK